MGHDKFSKILSGQKWGVSGNFGTFIGIIPSAFQRFRWLRAGTGRKTVPEKKIVHDLNIGGQLGQLKNILRSVSTVQKHLID